MPHLISGSKPAQKEHHTLRDSFPCIIRIIFPMKSDIPSCFLRQPRSRKMMDRKRILRPEYLSRLQRLRTQIVKRQEHHILPEHRLLTIELQMIPFHRQPGDHLHIGCQIICPVFLQEMSVIVVGEQHGDPFIIPTVRRRREADPAILPLPHRHPYKSRHGHGALSSGHSRRRKPISLPHTPLGSTHSPSRRSCFHSTR